MPPKKNVETENVFQNARLRKKPTKKKDPIKAIDAQLKKIKLDSDEGIKAKYAEMEIENDTKLRAKYTEMQNVFNQQAELFTSNEIARLRTLFDKEANLFTLNETARIEALATDMIQRTQERLEKANELLKINLSQCLAVSQSSHNLLQNAHLERDACKSALVKCKENNAYANCDRRIRQINVELASCRRDLAELRDKKTMNWTSSKPGKIDTDAKARRLESLKNKIWSSADPENVRHLALRNFVDTMRKWNISSDFI